MSDRGLLKWLNGICLARITAPVTPSPRVVDDVLAAYADWHVKHTNPDHKGRLDDAFAELHALEREWTLKLLA